MCAHLKLAKPNVFKSKKLKLINFKNEENRYLRLRNNLVNLIKFKRTNKDLKKKLNKTSLIERLTYLGLRLINLKNLEYRLRTRKRRRGQVGFL